MEQNYIERPAPPEGMPPDCPRSGGRAGMHHTLSVESLQFLVERLAHERGAELASACAVTPEGEKIDLLRPSRRRAGIPPAAEVRGC